MYFWAGTFAKITEPPTGKLTPVAIVNGPEPSGSAMVTVPLKIGQTITPRGVPGGSSFKKTVTS